MVAVKKRSMKTASLVKKNTKNSTADGVNFYNPETHGVTFSLLTAWKNCREYARLSLQGWTARTSGMAPIFGSIVHAVLHMVYDDIRKKKITTIPTAVQVKAYIALVILMWRRENPMASPDSLSDMEFTAMLAEGVLPAYFQNWYNDFQALEFDALETEFRIPLEIRSYVTGQMMKTFLRGKIDGAFRFKKSIDIQRLLETKTKSRIDLGTLADMLPMELQVNIYLYATAVLSGATPGGVLYNIIRRPGLRQKKGESLTQLANRVVEDVKARPEFYFVRMELSIDQSDLDKNEKDIISMVAEFLDWHAGRIGHYKNSSQCENKYGTCSMLPICAHGNYSHHYKREKVFGELSEY